MALKVINGNFTVSVYRDGQFKTISADSGAFDFTKDEIKDIEAAHGPESLRSPKNEAPAKADGKGKDENL